MENFELKELIILIFGLIYSVWDYILSFRRIYSILGNIVLLKVSEAKLKEKKMQFLLHQRAGKCGNGIPEGAQSIPWVPHSPVPTIIKKSQFYFF